MTRVSHAAEHSLASKSTRTFLSSRILETPASPTARFIENLYLPSDYRFGTSSFRKPVLSSPPTKGSPRICPPPNRLLTRADRFSLAIMPAFPWSWSAAAGGLLWDSDGREYLDLFAGFGAGILGHSHPALVEAVTRQAQQLWHVGNTYYTTPQIELAEWLNKTAFTGQAFFLPQRARSQRSRYQACPPARWNRFTQTVENGFHEPVVPRPIDGHDRRDGEPCRQGRVSNPSPPGSATSIWAILKGWPVKSTTKPPPLFSNPSRVKGVFILFRPIMRPSFAGFARLAMSR